ncbi:MAG: hypothetical protein PHG25_04365 [Candidatus Pacebacteria bacterium]|nr:hypothetical protein [Candidatus Paceibacterota bacterium]
MQALWITNRNNQRFLVIILGILIIGIMYFTRPNNQQVKAQEQPVKSYLDLPVGTYRYNDVWLRDTNNAFASDYMTAVRPVEILSKDPVHHSLSINENDSQWTLISLPRNTKIRGATSHPDADVFTGLLEVKTTAEGTKQINTYYPFKKQ